MSDSGRQIGDCRHGRTREYCADCLRAEVEMLTGLLFRAVSFVDDETISGAKLVADIRFAIGYELYRNRTGTPVKRGNSR